MRAAGAVRRRAKGEAGLEGTARHRHADTPEMENSEMFLTARGQKEELDMAEVDEVEAAAARTRP
jgi:hypothetical protein